MSKPIILTPEECILPVGFERNDGLLPYPSQSHCGYRLLTEFFTFPNKFFFVDLAGWDRVRATNVGRRIEIMIFFNRTLIRLEQMLDRQMLRLGCTPIVNLFEHTAEPIALNHLKPEYKVIPDVTQPSGYEVYSIRTVTAVSPQGEREFQPFYSFRHRLSRDQRTLFYYPARRSSLREGDRGTDVFLTLVDSEFKPTQPADSVIVVRTLCSNRDLPLKLPRIGDEVRFEPTFAAPVNRIQCLKNPTAPLRLPLRRSAAWRLISHLNLNYLSLTKDEDGLAAFQEILRLYDYADPQFDTHLSMVNRQLIEGIVGLKSRRITRRIQQQDNIAFARGLEITLTLDEEKYVGASMILYGAVLERFLALYASINSFTQLVMQSKQGETLVRRWQPRAGERILV
jgi:type VI secretion system protein ImpG